MSAKEDAEKESLVSRWSRRKQEARNRTQEAPIKPADSKPLPELPPVDKLSFDSDFSGFMDPRVDGAIRRIALKKLFNDPRFNATDGLDDYAEDYAALEDLPAALAEQLRHARSTLRGPEADESKAPEPKAVEGAMPPEEQTAELPPGPQSQLPTDAGPREDKNDVPKDTDKKNERNG